MSIFLHCLQLLVNSQTLYWTEQDEVKEVNATVRGTLILFDQTELLSINYAKGKGKFVWKQFQHINLSLGFVFLVTM